MKKETLEEAAKRLCPCDGYFDEIYCDIGEYDRKKWIEGAKWLKERSYSEEEVWSLLYKGVSQSLIEAEKLDEFAFDGDTLRIWFEQFKKEII